jgi:hypothetical protein
MAWSYLASTYKDGMVGNGIKVVAVNLPASSRFQVDA